MTNSVWSVTGAAVRGPRHSRSIRWWHRLAASVAAIACISGSAGADTIVIQGSTTFSARLMEPHLREIEQESGQQFQLIPNKSINGLIALSERRADLAMLSAPIAGELAMLRKYRPQTDAGDLRMFEVFRTRIAFTVHKSNQVRSASLLDIRRILLGEIDNWRHLGGADLPIRLVAVRDGGGVTVTVQMQVLDGKAIGAANAVRVDSPKQVIAVVKGEPAALGITQLKLLQDQAMPELVTDQTVEQSLTLVTIGEPTARAQAAISAIQNAAARHLR